MQSSTETIGVILAAFVGLVAVSLFLNQRRERRGRSADLSELDTRYFQRQDARRFLGSGLMLLLAFGLGFGSRIPVRLAGHGNPAYVQVWFGVIILLFCLLAMAMFDWIETFIYARRQHRDLAEQRLDLIRRHWPKAARRHELTDGSPPSNDAPNGL